MHSLIFFIEFTVGAGFGYFIRRVLESDEVAKAKKDILKTYSGIAVRDSEIRRLAYENERLKRVEEGLGVELNLRLKYIEELQGRLDTAQKLVAQPVKKSKK